MSAWRINRDCGRWFVSEIADTYANWESFATEAEAVEALRARQANELIAAEQGVEIAKQKVAEARAELTQPPRVTRIDPRTNAAQVKK